MKNKEFKFNVEHYSDGRLAKYGNEYDLDLYDAVDDLIYYSQFSDKYSEDALLEYLEEMTIGYKMHGTRFSEIKITKKQ